MMRAGILAIVLATAICAQSKEYVSWFDTYFYPNDQLKDKYLDDLDSQSRLRWDTDNTFYETDDVSDCMHFLIMYVPGYVLMPHTMQFMLMDHTLVHGPVCMMIDHNYIIQLCVSRSYARLIAHLRSIQYTSKFNPRRLEVHIRYLEYQRFRTDSWLY